MTVHRYLVTATGDLKMDLWMATAGHSNWIEGRENGERETWLVTVFNPESATFLAAAESTGATVEEIDGGDETETYRLVVGTPGTGWDGSAAQSAMRDSEHG